MQPDSPAYKQPVPEQLCCCAMHVVEQTLKMGALVQVCATFQGTDAAGNPAWAPNNGTQPP